MKTRFWNVQIEFYEDGKVNAAVLRNRLAETQPSDVYKPEPRREVYSLWFDNEIEAEGAVIDARNMTKVQGVAA